MVWLPFENGATVGQLGSENGAILRDEEYEQEARITLEGDGDIAPFAITCGIYGWMVHTRFFVTQAEAVAEFEWMKDGLAAILETIPLADDSQAEAKCRQVSDAIGAFVERFP